MGPDSVEHSGLPTSWRDVYALVRDTRADVLTAVEAVKTDVGHVKDDVATLAGRVNAIEVHDTEGKAASIQRARIGGFAKDTIALIASILAAVVATLSILTRVTPH